MALVFMFVGDQELDYIHNREPNQLGYCANFISVAGRKYSGEKKQLERERESFILAPVLSHSLSL